MGRVDRKRGHLTDRNGIVYTGGGRDQRKPVGHPRGLKQPRQRKERRNAKQQREGLSAVEVPRQNFGRIGELLKSLWIMLRPKDTPRFSRSANAI